MGGLIGGISANKASKRTAEAIREGNAIQERLGQQAIDLQRPIFEAGNTARTEQLNALGLNGAGAAGDSFGNFQDSGFYQAALDGFGVDRQYLDGSAAARGGLFSGAQIRALDDRARERATGAYGQFYNALAGISGAGQVASSNAGSILQNIGNNTASSLQNAAQVRGQGAQALGQGLDGFAASVGNNIFGFG